MILIIYFLWNNKITKWYKVVNTTVFPSLYLVRSQKKLHRISKVRGVRIKKRSFKAEMQNLQVNSPQTLSFRQKLKLRILKALIIKIDKEKYHRIFSYLIAKTIFFQINRILFLKVQIVTQKINRNLWNIIKEGNHVSE